MNNNVKATVFYKKKNKEIIRITRGEIGLEYLDIPNLDLEDKRLIYDCFTIDYDAFILQHITGLEVYENDDGTLNVKLKQEFIDKVTQYK